jgi:hypothetical protein
VGVPQKLPGGAHKGPARRSEGDRYPFPSADELQTATRGKALCKLLLSRLLPLLNEHRAYAPSTERPKDGSAPSKPPLCREDTSPSLERERAAIETAVPARAGWFLGPQGPWSPCRPRVCVLRLHRLRAARQHRYLLCAGHVYPFQQIHIEVYGPGRCLRALLSGANPPPRHHIYCSTAPPRSSGYAPEAATHPPLVRVPLAINTSGRAQKQDTTKYKTCFLTRHPIRQSGQEE